MSLAQTLRRASLTPQDIVHAEELITSLLGNDVLDVIISGSLIEGYGTSQSDLDVYIVSEVHPRAGSIQRGLFLELDDSDDNLCSSNDQEVHSAYQFLRGSGMHLDIKFVSLTQLENLFLRVRDSYRLSLSNDTIFYLNYVSSLSYEDEMLFHRLGAGHSLYQEKSVKEMLNRRPIDEFLLVQFRRRSISYPKIKDIQGALHERDFFMAIEIARAVSKNQLMALMHLKRCTNTNDKWIHKLSSKYAPDEFRQLKRIMEGGISNPLEAEAVLCRYLDFCEVMYEHIRKESQSEPWLQLFGDALVEFKNGVQKRSAFSHPGLYDARDLMMKNYESTARSLREIVYSAE